MNPEWKVCLSVGWIDKLHEKSAGAVHKYSMKWKVENGNKFVALSSFAVVFEATFSEKFLLVFAFVEVLSLKLISTKT